MKLHSNAALSLNGRRRLVAMVLEQGRSRAEPMRDDVSRAHGVDAGRTMERLRDQLRALDAQVRMDLLRDLSLATYSQ